MSHGSSSPGFESQVRVERMPMGDRSGAHFQAANLQVDAKMMSKLRGNSDVSSAFPAADSIFKPHGPSPKSPTKIAQAESRPSVNGDRGIGIKDFPGPGYPQPGPDGKQVSPKDTSEAPGPAGDTKNDDNGSDEPKFAPSRDDERPDRLPQFRPAGEDPRWKKPSGGDSGPNKPEFSPSGRDFNGTFRPAR
jgi:hypothetical protein